MGIHNLRQELKHLPGGRDLTMRYEDGGSVQVFKIGEEEVRLPGSEFPTAAAIEAELKKKL